MGLRFPILAGIAMAFIITLAEQPSFRPDNAAAVAEQLQQLTSAELQRHCVGDADARLRCRAFIWGSAAALSNPLLAAAGNLLCVPNDEDVDRLRAAFLRYAADHPDSLPQPAMRVIGPALRADYACPPQSWQAQG
jgi:hypothetical protein